MGWHHLVSKYRTNAGSAIWWPKLETMEFLTLIFLSSEFACFVAGEMIQAIEAIPGSVVPLAMFEKEIVQGPQKQCSQVKNKNLENLENLKNLENQENQKNHKNKQNKQKQKNHKK